MKYEEIVGRLKSEGPFDIEFTEGVEDLEGYEELNMRATVTSVSPVDSNGVYRVGTSYAKFDGFNQRFESPTYYDNSGVPRLTAREAGHYSLEDVLYCCEDAPFKPLKIEKVFTETDYAQYRASLNAKITTLEGLGDDPRLSGKVEGVKLALEELDRFFRGVPW